MSGETQCVLMAVDSPHSVLFLCVLQARGFYEDAVAFALSCEGSLWCGWGLFLLSGSKVSPTQAYVSLLCLATSAHELAAWRISCCRMRMSTLWLLVLRSCYLPTILQYYVGILVDVIVCFCPFQWKQLVNFMGLQPPLVLSSAHLLLITVNNLILSVFPFWVDTCCYWFHEMLCCGESKAEWLLSKTPALGFYLRLRTTVSLLVSIPIVAEPEVKAEGEESNWINLLVLSYSWCHIFHKVHGPESELEIDFLWGDLG